MTTAYPRPGPFNGARLKKPFRPDQRVFTTGMIAQICDVAPRTATKWIDAGRLKGYRIPLSNDRRVRREDLIPFLRDNGFDVPPELDEERPALVALAVGLPGPAPGTTAATAFAAGALVARGGVGRLLVGCAAGLDTACRVAEELRLHAPELPVALVLSDDRSTGDAPEGLFDAVYHESDAAALAAWAAGL